MSEEEVELNKKIEDKANDLTAEQDKKCIPIARQVLKIIADYEQGQIGNTGNAYEMRMSWTEPAETILKILLENDLNLEEVNYINRLCLQSFELTQTLVVDSLNDSLKRLQRKLFAGKELNELSLKYIENLLKAEPSV